MGKIKSNDHEENDFERHEIIIRREGLWPTHAFLAWKERKEELEADVKEKKELQNFEQIKEQEKLCTTSQYADDDGFKTPMLSGGPWDDSMTRQEMKAILKWYEPIHEDHPSKTERMTDGTRL